MAGTEGVKREILIIEDSVRTQERLKENIIQCLEGNEDKFTISVVDNETDVKSYLSTKKPCLITLDGQLKNCGLGERILRTSIYENNLLSKTIIYSAMNSFVDENQWVKEHNIHRHHKHRIHTLDGLNEDACNLLIEDIVKILDVDTLL